MTNSNPGGPGGRRRKIPTNKPRGKTSHRADKKGCAVIAIGMLGTTAGIIYGLTEAIRTVIG